MDALSQKAINMGSLVYLPTLERPFVYDIKYLANGMVVLDILHLVLILVYVKAHFPLFD